MFLHLVSFTILGLLLFGLYPNQDPDQESLSREINIIYQSLSRYKKKIFIYLFLFLN